MTSNKRFGGQAREDLSWCLHQWVGCWVAPSLLPSYKAARRISAWALVKLEFLSSTVDEHQKVHFTQRMILKYSNDSTAGVIKYIHSAALPRWMGLDWNVITWDDISITMFTLEGNTDHDLIRLKWMWLQFLHWSIMISYSDTWDFTDWQQHN